MTFDLVIAGLGAAGAAAAWRAAVRGMRVAGFDKHEPPHTLGSTHGRSRIIREAYFEHPQYVPLVQRAYKLWADLEASAHTRLFQACGGLMLGPRGSTVIEGTLRSAREHHLSVDEWTAAEVRARVPTLSPGADMVGVFEPRAGVLAPERGLAAMLSAARAAGAELFARQAVHGWQPTPEGVEVHTKPFNGPDRTIRARWLLLSVGPWLPSLLGGGMTDAVPFTVERVVQHWYPPAADDRFAPQKFPVFLLEAPDGRVLYGLPDQGDGLKLAEHHGGVLGPIGGIDRTVSIEEQHRFHDFARAWVSGLDARPRESSVCVYTNTPDGDFLLDWHPADPHVYIASPCSGHGFKFAPAIGEVVTSELLGEQPAVDLSPFRLARFTPR